MEKVALMMFVVALLAGSTFAAPIVVDDGDAGYSDAGSWTYGPEPNDGGDFNGDRGYTDTTTDTATWSFDTLANGTYTVYAAWVEHENRITMADYTISDGGGTITVDQTQSESHDLQITDLNSNAHWFQELGSVTISDSTLDVVLSFNPSTGGTYALADAVAVVIPEPATLALLGVGGCLMVLRRRRNVNVG